MKPFIPIVLLTLTALYSCQKVVNLDLNTVPPYTVIEGVVTDQPGPYTVTIRQSVNFSADNSFPAISGARVTIGDNEGVVDSLTETAPGTYTTHVLQGKPGNTYTLRAFAHDTLYTAVSAMPFPVTLDSVTFSQTSAFGNKSIRAIPNFQDPAGVKNYYQFIEYINGQQFTKGIFVLDDRLSDGRYISRNLRTDSSYLAIGDNLEVRMYCIDEPIFNYFDQLDQSSGGGAFNTTASPANPATNIDKKALGYFSAHTVRSVKTKVTL